MTEETLRAEVATTYAELVTRGLCVGSAGNVSVATDCGMLITRSGASAALSSADVVACDLAGTPEGELAPSSEWEMHAALYRSRSDARAVVHTHSDACVALSALGEPLPAFHYMVLGFGGADVRCAPYETFGTQALATAAVSAIAGRTACLLGNHGMICHGPNLKSALETASRLETLARQYIMALSVGTPRLLTLDQIRAAQERYRTYGQARA
ncbi:class II aldolase/adducin family protein [Novosphingobium flavum]|uniref:Class II aldolase/adducin family protein n=1 Tax=Novosphingobium flavum TaxID=1778672 RepID=A0A7X1FP38_9SPHN|nr:class II aldolase/adducin family protein [Novosphingobium flavum]